MLDISDFSFSSGSGVLRSLGFFVQAAGRSACHASKLPGARRRRRGVPP